MSSPTSAESTHHYKIGVKSVVLQKKQYKYHVQLFAGLKASNVGIEPMSRGSRTALIPLSLRGTTATAEVNEMESEKSWTQSDDDIQHYFVEHEDHLFTMHLHVIKEGSTKPKYFVETINLDTHTSNEVKFGRTANFCFCVKGPFPASELPTSNVKQTSAIEQQTFQSLAAAAAEMQVRASSVVKGSTSHRFLSEWGSTLEGVGELLAPLVTELPFGGALVATVQKLFSSVMGRGAVLELGAEICGQVALLLHVLSRPLVLQMIKKEKSSHSHLVRLERIMNSTVLLLQEFAATPTAFQVLRAKKTWDDLQSKSVEIGTTFTAIHQITSIYAQSEFGNDLKSILQVVESTKLLTAHDLCAQLLPHLADYLNATEARVTTALEKAHNDNSTAINALQIEMASALSTTSQEFLQEHASTSRTEATRVITEVKGYMTNIVIASAKSTLTAVAATMRSLLDEALESALPSTLTLLMDDSFKKSLEAVVRDTWISVCKREIVEATCYINEFTKQAAVDLEITFKSDIGSLSEQLSAVTELQNKVINEKFASLSSEISIDRTSISGAINELYAQRFVIDAMCSEFDALCGDDGKISNITDLLEVMPERIRTTLKPQCQLLKEMLEILNKMHSTKEDVARKFRRGTMEIMQAINAGDLEIYELKREVQQLRAELAKMSPKRLRFPNETFTIVTESCSEQERQEKLRKAGVQLRGKLQKVYDVRYATEQSVVSQLSLNRIGLYTSLRIVHAGGATVKHLSSAHETLEGVSMDSSAVWTVMAEQLSNSMLLLGRAGIGKTTWCIHMGLLQNVTSGVVIVLRLSDLANYFSGMEVSQDQGRIISPRELLYVSFGRDQQHDTLIDDIVALSRAGGSITWLVDGFDEVVSSQNSCMTVVKNVIYKFTGCVSRCTDRTTEATLFGPKDLVVLTSREQCSDVFGRIKFVATVNPWTKDDAIEYIGKYFSQKEVQDELQPPHGTSDDTYVTECKRCATNVVTSRKLGSFTTLPLYMEMLCWRVSLSPSTPASATELFKEVVAKKLQLAVRAGRISSSSPPGLMALCETLSVDKVTDDIFLTLDTTKTLQEELLGSGLVSYPDDRLVTVKVRFIHKSFLEYFQALYFSKNLDKLSQKVMESEVPTAPVKDSTSIPGPATQTHVPTLERADDRKYNESYLYTSPDDIIEVRVITGERDPRLDIKLQWIRHIGSPIEIVWLGDKGELKAYKKARASRFALRYAPKNGVTCTWNSDTEPEITLGKANVMSGKSYYLVLRPQTGQAIVPVRCIFPSSYKLLQRIPRCDIPGRRQQRNFFQLLTDLVSSSSEEKRESDQEQLLTFLFDRLEYHHVRGASFMRAAERPISSPVIPKVMNYCAEGQFHDDDFEERIDASLKASIVAEMGLSVVTECVLTLMETAHADFGERLRGIDEGSSPTGRACEALSLRSKAICEYALLPCAKEGSWKMWQGLMKYIPASQRKWLRGNLLSEALIVAMQHERTEIVQGLQESGIQLDLELACRLGATNVVLDEIRRVTNNGSTQTDATIFSALMAALSSLQLKTADALWKELENVKQATPQVWRLVFAPWAGVQLPRPLPAASVDWVRIDNMGKIRIDNIPQRLVFLRLLETEALQFFNGSTISRAVEARLVTLSGLLSYEKQPFLEHLEVANAFTSFQQENQEEVFHAAINFSKYPPEMIDLLFKRCNFEHLQKFDVVGFSSLSGDSSVRDVTIRGIAGAVTVSLSNCDLHEFNKLTFSENLRELVLNDTCLHVDSTKSIKNALRLTKLSVAKSAEKQAEKQVDTQHTSTRHTLAEQTHELLKHLIDSCPAPARSMLTHLSLVDVVRIPAGLFEAPICSKLQVLHLTNSAECVDNDVLRQLPPFIKDLRLCGCLRITNEGLASLANLVKLTHLSLARCTQVTDGLQHLEPLKSLESLNLAGCTEITDEALRSVGKLLWLSSLNLSRCIRITDASLLAPLKSLKYLDLSHCRHLVNKNSKLSNLPSAVSLAEVSIAHLSVGCAAQLPSFNELLTLDLSACWVSDDDLKLLSQKLTKLQTLRVARCSRITAKGVEHFVPHEHLKVLDLSATSIGDEIKPIEKRMPRLCIIDEDVPEEAKSDEERCENNNCTAE
ncbi:leucine-rich repeat protein, putative [Bodo saltans]|uniref:Leucine-rich repeat protein, putative n=1 Tax=Bodo saltans TaxID=75058 RepID=A0A0S4IHR7_BODSA|nr:leucine-rich repeat protein, putative [Bodo saltans]|eukprot:CUE68234.1 leucine-rich repeat protein, putative [Bodo saltans]